MADDSEQQPIVIKRIKGRHAAHHGGSWKVAFADFMTAMMAFFLVMWLVGQDDHVKESVSSYFKNPGKYQKMGKSGVLKGSDAVMNTPTWKSSMVKSPAKEETAGSKKEQDQMKLVARNILQELEKQKEFKRLRNNIKIKITSEGLRIILNESADAPAFFEPGSAKLLQKSAVILMTIAGELGTLSNHLVIEGHTDNSSTGNRAGYSNWELSADRANAARELMEVSGLFKGQVQEVRGFADKFPMVPGKLDDPRNRRVSLVVLYEARENLYDQIEVGEDLMSMID